MAKQYEPVDHSTLSKAGHTVGHAAGGGFLGGLGGAILAPFAAIGAVAGLGYLAFTAGSAALGAGVTLAGAGYAVGALAAGVATAVATAWALPIMGAVVLGGAAIGAWRSGSRGADKVNKERRSHAYQQSYDVQMAKMQGALAQQMEAAAMEREAYQQMALEHLRGASQQPEHNPAIAQGAPDAQELASHAATDMGEERHVPENVIAAQSAQHDNKIAAQELATARG